MMRVAIDDAMKRAIADGSFVRVELGAWLTFDDGSRAKSAFVGRVAGTLRAYANVCRHNPIELDLFEAPAKVRLAPIAEDGDHLMCTSHGALFRPRDGQCVLGPCFGQSLFSLGVVEDDDALTISTGDESP